MERESGGRRFLFHNISHDDSLSLCSRSFSPGSGKGLRLVQPLVRNRVLALADCPRVLPLRLREPTSRHTRARSPRTSARVGEVDERVLDGGTGREEGLCRRVSRRVSVVGQGLLPAMG